MLHAAAQAGQRGNAEFLRELCTDWRGGVLAGADVDVRDYTGDTPVHWAAWLGEHRLVEVLVTGFGRVVGYPLSHNVILQSQNTTFN